MGAHTKKRNKNKKKVSEQSLIPHILLIYSPRNPVQTNLCAVFCPPSCETKCRLESVFLRRFDRRALSSHRVIPLRPLFGHGGGGSPCSSSFFLSHAGWYIASPRDTEVSGSSLPFFGGVELIFCAVGSDTTRRPRAIAKQQSPKTLLTPSRARSTMTPAVPDQQQGSNLIPGPRPPRLRGRQRSLLADPVHSRAYSLVGSAPTIVLRAADEAGRVAAEKKRTSIASSFASAGECEATCAGTDQLSASSTQDTTTQHETAAERSKRTERWWRVAAELRESERTYLDVLETIDEVSFTFLRLLQSCHTDLLRP